MSTIKVDKLQGTSGSVTGLTFSGANGTFGGTLAVTGVHTVGNNAIATSEGGAVTTSVVQGLAKCYGRFSSTQFNDSFNMSSFTDNSTGNHTLNFNNDMANTNYTNSYGSEGGSDVFRYMYESGTNTGSTVIKTYYFTNAVGPTQGDFGDNAYCNHGDLA